MTRRIGTHIQRQLPLHLMPGEEMWGLPAIAPHLVPLKSVSASAKRYLTDCRYDALRENFAREVSANWHATLELLA